MRAQWIGAVAALAVGSPITADAHPHVFIDAKVDVQLDAENRATAVRVFWIYDEFFSLSMVADMGLDSDGDGTLSAEDTAKLSGFDMRWDPSFPGDTYVLHSEAEVALSRPRDFDATYDGVKITSSHWRDLERPVDLTGLPLIVQVYDPGYYVAYRIAGETDVLGGTGGCSAVAYGPDLEAADEELRAALAEYGADVNLEMEFPAVGAVYAEEVRISCPAP
jgi:ABC-type uncharacterized transport system substrate-binding protein